MSLIKEERGSRAVTNAYGLNSITSMYSRSWQPSSILPFPHPNIQTKRLPQEAFLGFEVVLIQLEFIPPENSANKKCKLHLGDVASNTGSRAIREGDESALLPIELSA